MKISILSINHNDQVIPLKDALLIPDVLEKKEQLRARVRELMARRGVDLICEESDPCCLSIAQDEAFKADPRVHWKNINMTSQERLEAGVWDALLYRPFEMNEERSIAIHHRVAEDDIREEFFKEEIIKAARDSSAKSVLVLCGDMHTEALKVKLDGAGYPTEANHDLIPEKYWK